jgi:hypothetical protein
MVIYLIGADEYGGDDVNLIDNDAAQGAGGALQAGVVKVEDDQRRFGDLEYNWWSLVSHAIRCCGIGADYACLHAYRGRLSRAGVGTKSWPAR